MQKRSAACVHDPEAKSFVLGDAGYQGPFKGVASFFENGGIRLRARLRRFCSQFVSSTCLFNGLIDVAAGQTDSMAGGSPVGSATISPEATSCRPRLKGNDSGSNRQIETTCLGTDWDPQTPLRIGL